MKEISPSESNRLPYPPIPAPARISHQLFAAAGDAPHPAVFSHLGVLDVPSSTTPRPSDRKRHWARHLAALASKSGEKCGLGLLILLLVAAGCATVGESTPDSHIETLPAEAKASVHVIFVNSPLDVLQIGRLAGVASYFRSKGFQNSSFHYLSSGPKLAGEVRDLRREDDGARVALVAWSGASLWVWDALKELDETGARVDLIVYLDSNWIKKRVADEGHPDNFDRAVLIYRSDNPPVEGVPNSVIRRAETINHLAVAAHPDTVRALGEELARLAE